MKPILAIETGITDNRLSSSMVIPHIVCSDGVSSGGGPCGLRLGRGPHYRWPATPTS